MVWAGTAVPTYREPCDESIAVSGRHHSQASYRGPRPQAVGIVDANAILSSVDNDGRNDRDSRLPRSTLFGYTTLYASDYVHTAIYVKVAENRSVFAGTSR